MFCFILLIPFDNQSEQSTNRLGMEISISSAYFFRLFSTARFLLVPKLFVVFGAIFNASSRHFLN